MLRVTRVDRRACGVRCEVAGGLTASILAMPTTMLTVLVELRKLELGLNMALARPPHESRLATQSFLSMIRRIFFSSRIEWSKPDRSLTHQTGDIADSQPLSRRSVDALERDVCGGSAE